ncbi:MAG: hypothetical protein HY869_20855 [Chloroflexi bacterium]|nr:hypothetical protein [Chloroflexota bacterium]
MTTNLWGRHGGGRVGWGTRPPAVHAPLEKRLLCGLELPAGQSMKRGNNPAASLARDGGGHGAEREHGQGCRQTRCNGQRASARHEENSDGTASSGGQAAADEASGKRDRKRTASQPGHRQTNTRGGLHNGHGRQGASTSARRREGGKGADLPKRRGTKRARYNLGIGASRAAHMDGLARGEDGRDNLSEQGRRSKRTRAAEIN